MEIGKTRFSMGKAVVIFVLSVGALIMIVPFFWMALTSFKTYGETLKQPIQWLPSSIQVGNYREVLNKLTFARYYVNTIVVTVSITVLQMLFCSMAAYGFARLRFPGSTALFFILLSMLMIPQQMTLIPSFVLLTKLRWIDTFWALVVPNLFSAYGTFFLRQFFLCLPDELEEAAIIDGCSRGGVYWRIFMPLCGSPLAAFAVFTVMWAWNDLMWPLIMTSKDSVRVLSVGIATLVGQYSTKNNLLMAASMLATVPMIVLFILLQKQFIAGVATTGLKC